MAPRGRRVKKRKFEQEHVEKALVKMMIFYQVPFSCVEEEGFKQLMEDAFPVFQIPSREIIFRYCAQLFVDEKLRLKSFIKGTKQRVCLTLDTWMSKQSVNYLCITVHFIDNNWNLQKNVISFTPVSSDEGEEIGRVVEKCLRDWEIDNVMTISTRNRSSYDVAVSYLRGRLADSVSDGKFLHLKCFVDFTNSMVKQILNEHDTSIARVRAAVRYMLQSPARIAKFKKRAREYGIISKSFLSLDCPTKWNSTFTMLETAKEFEVIMDLFESDYTYTRNLENACGVVIFLKGFYQSTVNILSSYVTSNMFLNEVANIDFHLSSWGKSCGGNDGKRFFKSLEMISKFYEYWGEVEKSNLLIYVANILDPRHKMDFIEFYFLNNDTYKHEYTCEGIPLWKKKAEFVISATYDLFNEYMSRTGAPQQNANFQTSGYMHYLYEEDTSHRGLGQRRTVGFGGNVKCKTEIDIYLNEDSCHDFNGFDILLWWKHNSARFPVLSKMAKDVLAIPILAISSGSAFSTSDNLLDDFQSSLSPAVAEGLVCTNDWISEHIKVDDELPTFDNFVKGIFELLDLEDATSRGIA